MIKASKLLAPTGVLRVGVNVQNPLLVKIAPNGELDGIAPTVAKSIAEFISVPIQYVRYESAKRLADSVDDDAWDVAFLAADPERAAHIAFTKAYCELEASFLVRNTARLERLEQIDAAEVSIAVSAGSAYDLWLERNIKRAKLVRAATLAGSASVFIEQNLDVLAGLKPWLTNWAEHLQNVSLLEQSFMGVQQGIGLKHGKPDAVSYLNEVIESFTASGLLHDMVGQFQSAGLRVPDQQGDLV